jgi:ABC-2 type transport system permease protein
MNAMTTYARAELVRTYRNRRFFAFSLSFPLLVYFLVATPNRHEHDLAGSGISAPLYLMVGLATVGTMNAVLGTGGRIAIERTVGWTRHLRATPLRPPAYIGTKVAIGYLTALVTIAVMYVAGYSLGVRLPLLDWLGMTGLLLIGLLPFAALGILIGHAVSVDAIGPAIGGTSAVMGFLGGAWFPLGTGFMHDVAQALPSYWLVHSSAVSLGGAGWSVTGWLVVLGWAAVLAAGAVWAYRRDTERA